MFLFWGLCITGCDWLLLGTPPVTTNGDAQGGDSEPWTAQAVQGNLCEDATRLQAAAAEQNVFDPDFLERLTRRYASALGGISGHSLPMGTAYLRNLDGEPVAFSAVFSTSDATEVAGAGAPAADWESVANTLNSVEGRFARDMTSQQGSEVVQLFNQLRMPESFMNVIVGASPACPLLLSTGPGLPPQVFARQARKKVAGYAGLSAGAVTSVRAFYEPRMPKGFEAGVICRVVRASADSTAAAAPADPESDLYVYLVPSGIHGTGRAVELSKYRSLVTEVVRQSSETKPRAALAAMRNAANWGKMMAMMGLDDTSAACPNCEAELMTPLTQGRLDYIHSYMGTSGDGDAECYYTYSDGTTKTAISCDNSETYCCDLGDDDCWDGNYVESCTCTETSDYSYESSNGLFIRGVPTLYQNTIGYTICNGLYVNEETAVGCGPLAGTELVIWYASLGWPDLVDGYVNSSGKIDWQELAATLRTSEYMAGDCVPFSATEDGDIQTMTTANEFADGISQYFEDKGYSATVTKVNVQDEDADTYFEEIKDEIDSYRPVAILFCIDEASCEGGIGITSSALNDWFQAHIALITGYYEEGGIRYVYLDMGWAAGGNTMYEWNIPDGSVRLVFVEPDGGLLSATACYADDLSSYLQDYDSSYIGYSCKYECDDYTEVETIAGSVCDMLSGTETVSGTQTSTSTTPCVTPEDIETLEDVMSEMCEENPYLPDCDDRYDTDPPMRRVP